MGDWGLKISLPEYDVKTATPEQCAFHSKYSSPKIALGKDPAHFGYYTHTLDETIPELDSITLLSVAHEYSYIPASICIVTDNTFGDGLTGLMPWYGGPWLYIYSYCDDTNFEIIAYSASGYEGNGEIFDFKYYIFADEGA